MKEAKKNVKLIESQTVTREYGFTGINAIIEHPDYGRILIMDGYGGEGTMAGGCVRWFHGAAYHLLKNDSLKSLQSTMINEDVSTFEALIHGYDSKRDPICVHGRIIASMAKDAGLSD
jgi:hypothetical protein